MRYRYRLNYVRNFIDGHLKGIRQEVSDRFVGRGDVEAFLMCVRGARINEAFVDKDDYDFKKSCTFTLEEFRLIDLRTELPVPL